jgi:hypothetical protein
MAIAVKKTAKTSKAKVGRKPTKKTAAKATKKPTVKSAPAAQNSIALIYDFDGTLSPKNMQEYAFLPKIGLDPKKFWAEVAKLSYEREAEPLITYMHLMYQKAQEKGVHILREDLVAQGRDVEFCPGVEEWFDLIEGYVKDKSEGEVTVRHYLVSSGLKEIIEGTSIVDKFHNVFASEYFFEAYQLPYPKRVITDTSKTQYLFRINKGVEDVNKSINSHMPVNERPVPFQQMIYFGDGETDVPSMAVTRQNNGYAMAVYPKEKSPKICKELFKVGRVDFYAEADYREGSDLHSRTLLLIDKILCEIKVRQEKEML